MKTSPKSHSSLNIHRSSIKVVQSFQLLLHPLVCSVWSWSSLSSQYSPCDQTQVIPVIACLDAKWADRPGSITCYQQELDWQATPIENGWIAKNCLPESKEKPKSQIVFFWRRVMREALQGRNLALGDVDKYQKYPQSSSVPVQGLTHVIPAYCLSARSELSWDGIYLLQGFSILSDLVDLFYSAKKICH